MFVFMKIAGLFCLFFLIGVAISYIIFWHNRHDRKIYRNQALSRTRRIVLCYSLYLFDFLIASLLFLFFLYLLKETEFSGTNKDTWKAIFNIGGLISLLLAPILLRKKVFEKRYTDSKKSVD